MIKSYNKFYKEIENQKLHIDEIVIFKGDKIVSKAFWYPHEPNTLHRMYSVTKTLTMLAIGLLITENKISLNDLIVDFFDYNVVDENINMMTIRNLLTMQTAFNKTTYKGWEGSWLESFFKTRSDKIPGTQFSYDTSASYVLSALVEKITNMDMMDYLRTYFNFSKESYIIKSPENISSGGSGLMATINDLILIGNIIKTNGLNIINEEYILNSKLKQVDTSQTTEGFDFEFGYGYQTWLNSLNGFTIYGMGGQLYYYDKKNDISLVTLSNLMDHKNGSQKVIDLYKLYLKDIPETLANPYIYKGFKFSNQKLSLLKINKNYETKDNKKIKLFINKNYGSLKIDNDEIKFSMIDFEKGVFPNTKEEYYAEGIVKNNNLYINLHLYKEELGILKINVIYNENNIEVISEGHSENYLKKWNFKMKGYMKNEKK